MKYKKGMIVNSKFPYSPEFYGFIRVLRKYFSLNWYKEGSPENTTKNIYTTTEIEECSTFITDIFS